MTSTSTAAAPHDTTMARTGGYAPIAAYAVLGDGRTVALVALDGDIDWWALPVADAPPAFAALLDPGAGGRIRLAPEAPSEATRRYLEGTNVVETTFRTPTGVVKVTDALNLSATGLLPWTELARTVEGVEGEVPMVWDVTPGDRFASAHAWAVRTARGRPVIRLSDQTLGIVATAVGEPVVEPRAVRGRFVARPGSDHLLAVVSTDGEPLYFPGARFVRRRTAETVEWWRAWDRRIHYDGPWPDAVRRSALVLKTLTSATTGAILAAPTSSLPEIPGGPKNYDYRFAWVRDMAFAIGAMLALDVEEEVHASLSWLLGTVGRTAPDIHVFYTIDGRVAEAAAEVPYRGYRDSRPVQSGNRAEGQTQLESYGALFDPVWGYVQEGGHLDDLTGTMIAACADRVCDIWPRRDAGLWELTDLQHYTASKVGCWTALDRAVKLADAGQVPDRHRDRWVAERAALRGWVEERCWSDAKGAYTFYAGTDDLDGAVLLGARIGFDRGERMASTIDALRRELGRGPLLYRYSAMVGEEGAFLACSFWLAEALALTGRVDEAGALMDELCTLANDVGLYSEEMDPASHAMLGNFPQALTHLALVNAATVIERQRNAPS